MTNTDNTPHPDTDRWCRNAADVIRREKGGVMAWSADATGTGIMAVGYPTPCTATGKPHTPRSIRIDLDADVPEANDCKRCGQPTAVVAHRRFVGWSDEEDDLTISISAWMLWNEAKFAASLRR